MTGRARGRLLGGAAAALLLGPTVLAFLTGGYFNGPRVWGGLIAWLLVLVAALRGGTLPRGRAGATVLISLALLAGWTLASVAWAPVAGSALAAGQRAWLYTGVLLAAAMLLGHRPARQLSVPALLAGTVIVIGYALAERLLPGVLHFTHSASAQGRLEQPITYWNALGELAAIGLVLAIALAAEADRPPAVGRIAAACTAPLGLALYLTYSRGALFALGAGLVCLLVASPRRRTAHAVLSGLAAAVLVSGLAAPLAAFTAGHGSLGAREAEGAAMFIALLAVAGGAALMTRSSQARPDRQLGLPPRAPLLAAGLICTGLAVAIVLGAKEGASRPLAAGATRLTTFQSDRYDYWRVAVHAFGSQPLHGVGAGGWAVQWLRHRPYAVGAQDAHSLPLQTLAELGVVGLVLLLAWLGGLAAAARRALAADRVRAVAPLAALVAYLAHAPLDWDWEMPAVTVLGLIPAGLLLALGMPARPGGGAASAAAERRQRRFGAGRALVALAAVVAAAWFAIGVRSHLLVDDVQSFLSAHPHLSDAQGHRLDRRVDAARLLDPDRELQLLHVYVQVQAGHLGRAADLALRIARGEPQNYGNWLALLFIAGGRPAVYHLATSRLRALAPPVPAPR